mgnify:CR=1 FL=1
MDIKLENGDSVRVKKELNLTERKALGDIFNGKKNASGKGIREILERPHVAIAFEALLEKHNLSDDRLIKRLAEIIRREPTNSINDKGIKTTNITAIDANARDTIRMVWQAQGKFVDRKEIGAPGDFKKLTDEELDKTIDSGINFLLNRGKNTLNNGPKPDTLIGTAN